MLKTWIGTEHWSFCVHVRVHVLPPTICLRKREKKKNPPAKLQNRNDRNEDPFPQIKDQKWLQLGRGQRETEIVFLLSSYKTAHCRTEQTKCQCLCLLSTSGGWKLIISQRLRAKATIRKVMFQAVAHRMLTVTIPAKPKKKKKLNNVHGLVRELWGSWPGCCSLTPSPLASFSVTNRRLPAKLFPNRWICFLQQGAFLFFVLNKAKYHCCLSLQHSAVYFTPRAMGISQEDKLPDRLLYSLPAAPQITSAYVYTPCFKSQTTPQDSSAVLSSCDTIPSTQENIFFI